MIELLVTLAIIGILASLSYPLYTQHVIRTRRTEGKIALIKLAAKLEIYYTENNSYAGANLKNLGVNHITKHKFYQLQIARVEKDSFLIKAVPTGPQAKDHMCGKLILNQAGEQKISGNGSVEMCW